MQGGAVADQTSYRSHLTETRCLRAKTDVTTANRYSMAAEHLSDPSDSLSQLQIADGKMDGGELR